MSAYHCYLLRMKKIIVLFLMSPMFAQACPDLSGEYRFDPDWCDVKYGFAGGHFRHILYFPGVYRYGDSIMLLHNYRNYNPDSDHLIIKQNACDSMQIENKLFANVGEKKTIILSKSYARAFRISKNKVGGWGLTSTMNEQSIHGNELFISGNRRLIKKIRYEEENHWNLSLDENKDLIYSIEFASHNKFAFAHFSKRVGKGNCKLFRVK